MKKYVRFNIYKVDREVKDPVNSASKDVTESTRYDIFCQIDVIILLQVDKQTQSLNIKTQ